MSDNDNTNDESLSGTKLELTCVVAVVLVVVVVVAAVASTVAAVEFLSVCPHRLLLIFFDFVSHFLLLGR